MSQQEQQNSRLKRERCVLRQDISRGVFNVCKCVCLCSFSSLFFISNCIFGISFKRYKFFFFNIRCRKSSSLQCLPGLYLFFYLNIIVTFGQSQNNFFILLLWYLLFIFTMKLHVNKMPLHCASGLECRDFQTLPSLKPEVCCCLPEQSRVTHAYTLIA